MEKPRTLTSKAGRDSFLGWFDVSFEGSPHNPSLVEVVCSTGPSLNEWTHWGQEAFVVDQPVALENGDKIEGTITMARAQHDWRMYDVTIEHTSMPLLKERHQWCHTTLNF